MIASMLLALAVTAQQGQTKPAPVPSGRSAPRGELPETPDHPAPVSTLPPSTPDGLRVIQRLGACVADASTAKARRTLSSDFRQGGYRLALKQLADANRTCPSFRGYTRLRSSNLLFAGAIAERLIERDGVAVNRELAKAAGKPAPPTYSVTDGAAMCVVRSSPDGVAKLFAADVATPEEQAASAPLQQVMSRCLSGRPVDVTTDGLRAMLATAAFRSIHAASAAPRS